MSVIGFHNPDERRNDINSWNGQNLLGFSLMLVRDELRNHTM